MKRLKRVRIALFMVLAMMFFVAAPLEVSASVSGNNVGASSSDRERYQTEITNYVVNLKYANVLKDETSKKLDSMLTSVRNYIENTDMSAEDIATYVADIKMQMDSIVKNQYAGEPSNASDFLALADNFATPVANYGKTVNVVLPILNLSEAALSDIVITPIVDVSVSKWPFELGTTGFTKTVESISGSKTYDEAFQRRQEVTYTFQTREDVLTGYYKLDFEVKYNRNGNTEKTTLSTFVNAVGAIGSGTVDASGDSQGNSSKPRIIVTGFETNPADVYAGDTFTVTIHIQNTSKRTAVSNMQIDLKATPEGTTDNKYEAFLPTSGSNTVYIDRIPAGGTADLAIEMTAKADLTQKPYVLEVKMEYEDDKFTSYTSDASVSIPIKQASKFDSSTPEVMPKALMWVISPMLCSAFTISEKQLFTMYR